MAAAVSRTTLVSIGLGIRFGHRLRFGLAHKGRSLRSLVVVLQRLVVDRLVVIQRILMTTIVVLLVELLRMMRVYLDLGKILHDVAQVFIRHSVVIGHFVHP